MTSHVTDDKKGDIWSFSKQIAAGRLFSTSTVAGDSCGFSDHIVINTIVYFTKHYLNLNLSQGSSNMVSGNAQIQSNEVKIERK